MVSNTYVDGTYATANPSWHTEDSRWKAARILDAIKRNHLTPQTIAEIGCGPGKILTAMGAKLDAEYVGFEPSPDAVAIAERFVRRGGIEQMGRYDLVLCIDVFEHVEDPFSFLRSLKDHGKDFIFHIPLDMNCYAVMRRIPLINRKALGHLHYYDKETALALLVDCGYRVQDCFYTNVAEVHGFPLRKIVKRIAFRWSPELAARLLAGFSLMVTCQ